MQTPHDALFKQVFSQPQHAAGMLRAALPDPVARHIDWSTLALCPGSFVDHALRDRHTDLLFSVELRGKPALIYLVAEHKSGPYRLTAFQMLGYVVRLLEGHLDRHPGKQSLPAVICVVVHHSEAGWQDACELLDLVDLDPAVRADLAPYLPGLRLVVEDLSTADEEALRQSAMSALAKLALFCLERARHSGDLLGELRSWAGVLRSVLDAPSGHDALASVLSYIMEVTELPAPDLGQFLALEVGPQTEDAMKSTADRLRESGRAEVLLKLLAQRFGPLDDAVTARVQTATKPELDRWTDRLLSAPDLEAVLGAD